MTLSRWLVSLALILTIALPPLDAGAMFRNEAGRAEANDDDDGSAEDAGGEDVVRGTAAGAIAPAIATANQDRRRQRLRDTAVFTILQSDPEEQADLAERLSRGLEDDEVLDAREIADLKAAVEASLAAPAPPEAASSSSSSASATATARAASAAAAPRSRPKFQSRGKATNLAEVARSADLRARPVEEERRYIRTGIAPADLGATAVRASHSDLERLLSENISRLSRSPENRRLVAVRDALEAANALLPALSAARVGQMPPDLAEALISAADRGGRAAVPTGRLPGTFVRRLATTADGVDASQLTDTESVATIRRVQALDSLIAAANAAARDQVPGKDLQRSLEAVAREATDDRARLVAFLNAAARDYPRAFATVILPADQLGPPAKGGVNASPRPARFDFATGNARNFGPYTAMFKPTEVGIKADGGLSMTGVAEQDEIPSRLEQRSVATRRMAELLGIGDMVVNMQMAYLTDEARTFGLLMSFAPGDPGMVERNDLPDGFAYVEYLNVTAKLAEADEMLRFLTKPAEGRGLPPATPLVTADNPSAATWTNQQWNDHRRDLLNDLLDIPVRNIGTEAAPNLVGVMQERAITDAHLADPALRRQLSNAQWLDLLCGQVDRHMGNLFIDTSGPSPVVTLIDNDLAFGIDNAVYGLDKASSVPQFRLPPKPYTVDAAFRKAFNAVNENSLREATRGLLLPAEQVALIGRFRMLKSYMNSRDVRVVYPPGTQGKSGDLRWDADPALLFRGHDNPDRHAKSGEYSYYGLLSAFPVRPATAAPSRTGN